MTEFTSPAVLHRAALLRRAGLLSGALAFLAALPLAGLVPLASLLTVTLLTVTSSSAQARYSDRSSLAERQRTGIAFDSLRGRMVLFGGFAGRTGLSGGTNLNETYEQESAGWVRRTPPSGPPASDLASAIAYDVPNKRIIYFTFGQATRQPETWRYDGRNWARFLGITNNPNFRQNYAAAFDYNRGVLVLFGGSDTTGTFLDTWEFDGLEWRQIATPGPSGRNDPTMAYDASTGRMVLFGGRSATQQALADTWSWDGSTWTALSPATSPTARHSAAAHYDVARGEVVLFGGASGLPGTRFDDTWVWSGGTWTQRSPAQHPSARNGHAMTYRSDRSRVVLACGDSVGGLQSDTWEWDGTNWTESVPAESPTARTEHATCFNSASGRVVLFGGKDASNLALGDTWVWNIGSWRESHPATSPPRRSDSAMAEDTTGGNVILFGGAGTAGVLGDTWRWDGTNWSQLTPATVPPTRSGHTMVWDSTRQVIVMFGGARGTTILDDLWEWNGTDWRAVTPGVRPIARWNHGMAYNPAIQQMVMFGGRNSFGGKLNDTWIYDGAAGTWTQRIVTPLPSARDNFGMFYDAIRQRVTIFSGFGASSYVSDTYDWSGSAWSSVFVFPSPQARQSMSMTYDGAGRRALMFGGQTSTGAKQETWLFTTHPVAGVTPHGQPCPGATGSAVLTGFGNPALGATSFAIDLVSPTPPTTVPVFFVLTALPGTATIGSCTLSLDASTVFYTAYRLQFGVGFASMALPIPANTNLLNIQFYAVAAYVDPPTTLNGLAFSQQAKITIGD